MKTTVIAASAIAAVLGTAALAMTPEELASQLVAEGYTQVEIDTDGSEISVEGYKDGFEREIVLASDGSVLSDVMSQDHDDSDPDDGEDDDDEDEDEDEGQDDDEDEDEDEDDDDGDDDEDDDDDDE